MKRKIIFFILSILVNGLLYAQISLVDSIITSTSLHSIVEYLAADSLKGRFSGSEGCTKAALFIEKEFKDAGLKPVAGNDGYFMPVTFSWGNVVGAIQGKSKADEVIIFSAHYDHIGTLATNPALSMGGNAKVRRKDSIYNGANDNASGISALIDLARYFVKENTNERTILFVAFAGEELGVLGSEYFTSFIKPDLIEAVINMDMIGRKDGSRNSPYMTGPNLSNLYDILNSRLYKEDPEKYKKNFIDRDRFAFENLFSRSDNYPFAELGIPAHTIMATSPLDPYYHSLSDEPSTLDYEFMCRVVKSIALSCEGLVTGEDTPTRITSLQ
jgi:Zn-dependent M28 family amino/carboxypeptidase